MKKPKCWTKRFFVSSRVIRGYCQWSSTVNNLATQKEHIPHVDTQSGKNPQFGQVLLWIRDMDNLQQEVLHIVGLCHQVNIAKGDKHCKNNKLISKILKNSITQNKI